MNIEPRGFDAVKMLKTCAVGHLYLYGGRSNRCLLQGEESPDFVGEDTSETLGAVRLRKVQQKINRYTLRRRKPT